MEKVNKLKRNSISIRWLKHLAIVRGVISVCFEVGYFRFCPFQFKYLSTCSFPNDNSHTKNCVEGTSFPGTGTE